MGDLWKWRYEEFFSPKEVKIIEDMGLESIFCDLYYFYANECSSKEGQRVFIREAYESILHAHDKFKAQAEERSQ